MTITLSCPGASILHLNVSSLDYADVAGTVQSLIAQGWHVHVTVNGRHWTVRPGDNWRAQLDAALGVNATFSAVLAVGFLVFMLLGVSVWIMNRLV